MANLNWSKVQTALEFAVVPFAKGHIENLESESKVFPGAVLLVAQGGEVIFKQAAGCRSLLPEVTQMEEHLVFDIASLTKALCTTTLVMKLVERGVVAIDRKVSRILQSFTTHGKENISVRHLLNHSAGYPAVVPYYKLIARADSEDRAGVLCSRGAVEMVFNEILQLNINSTPGTTTVYSDIGFILLGHIIEVLSGGTHLDKIVQKEIISPLQLRSMGFIDLSRLRRRGLTPVTEVIVPTNKCPWRKKIICGEVQDENAWAMGGIAGHAGLFSTAEDVHKVAWELISSWHGRSKFVERDVIREFWRCEKSVPNSTWALGWDTPNLEESSAGKHFSKSGIGHLGYTGCSIWLDPESELEIILLSNRVHPSTSNERIRAFRPLIHDLVMEALNLS